MLIYYAVSALCLFYPCVELPLSESHGEGPLQPDATVIAVAPDAGEKYRKNHTNDFSHSVAHFQDNPNIIIPQRPNPIVFIRDGGLMGFNMKTIRGRDIEAYQSIPFAQPPVGPLRFKNPLKNLPWRGIREAVETTPSCIQTDFIQQYKLVGQEDCLYLNVYRPVTTRFNRINAHGLPVMVFIHGGGFFFGSSNLYGPSYLLEQDIILVSMNYRLGPLGFMALGDTTSPGNVGLKDQVMALEWIQENIRAFGGDPNKVTLFGESAGAGSVHYHMLSPKSRGLFHRGISQSGCAMCFWSFSEQAVNISKTYSSRLNCTGTSVEIIDCLQTKDASALVTSQLLFLEWEMYPVVIFGPVIEPIHEEAFIDELPEETYKRGDVLPVPWISGLNSEEGSINIAVLLLNNASLTQLNDKWEDFGHIFLDLKHSSNDSVAVAKNAKQFYLGNKPISFETRNESGRMFSDRYTTVCAIKGVRYHSKYTGAPTYTYHLSHEGNHSYVELLGQNAKDWGVSHLDDLIYLFNNTAHYKTLTVDTEDYKMAETLINMWVNFATTGYPLLTLNGQDKHVWKPVARGENSELLFLDIDLNPKMIRNPFSKRSQFWESQKLLNE